jgi:[ribosomal protein S18]-alanine N-acetyltransferase
MTKSSCEQLRMACPEDLPAILDIEAQSFDPARRSSRKSLKRSIYSRLQRVLVQDLDGAIAGYVILWAFPRTWRVYNLASHPSRRNQGVGRTLLNAAARLAAEAGAQRLVLESRPDPALLRFYEQRGFRVRARLEDYYAPGEDAVRMDLAL